MNRKSLSIIAAIGLSLSSASQITAGNSASVIAVGTLATAAGVSHYRGAQIQRYEREQARLQIAEYMQQSKLIEKTIGGKSKEIPNSTCEVIVIGAGGQRSTVSGWGTFLTTLPTVTTNWKRGGYCYSIDYAKPLHRLGFTPCLARITNEDDASYIKRLTSQRDELLAQETERVTAVIARGEDPLSLIDPKLN